MLLTSGCVQCRMFIETCKRLKIMKGADAIGLGMFYVTLHFANQFVASALDTFRYVLKGNETR